MSSSSIEEEDGGMFVVVNCLHPPNNSQLFITSLLQDYDDINNKSVTISTSDVNTWNLSSILQHNNKIIIKLEAHRNRLMQQSSYFNALLAGNFSDPDVQVFVQWDQPTFLTLVASLFGSPLDVTSDNFLSLFKGALYFGMEMVLLKCRTWLTQAVSASRAPLVQLSDLFSIWEFGSEIGEFVFAAMTQVNYLRELCTSYLAKNFIWAISCNSFGDAPHDLLLSTIKHPELTVESEKQLCDALLAWITANKEQCTEDVCVNLLKEIRISLLPLWFIAGKNTHESSLSTCCNDSFDGANFLLKQSSACCMDALADGDLLNLRIRLSEFTQRVDLSNSLQIKPTILLLSMLPLSEIFEPLLRKRVEQLLMSHEPRNANAFRISWEICPKLTFEAVHEIDISNCPMLHLEIAIECFSSSFPSLKTLKATNHLKFRTTKFLQLANKCPLLCDVDLTVDISPVIPTPVSVLSSFGSSDSGGSSLAASWSYISGPLPSSIKKLTLEGRNDVTDFDLRIISDICVSLTYLSIKGCTSVSDAGISSLICKCLKLTSIVACYTLFGQQSIIALCSPNVSCDDVIEEDRGKRSNIQMLHIGGCKGINTNSFSKLMCQAYLLKSLCLRDSEVVDDGLYSFVGSSLEVLDVSNTKVSAGAVAHVISRNSGLKCLKARGCHNLLQQESRNGGGNFPSKNLYSELGKCCRLNEISVGWGFSYLFLEAFEASISLLNTIEVGLGGSLGQDGLKLLPEVCPLLESVALYFQVISDQLIVNLLDFLRNLKSFAMCHCLGEISSSSFNVSMPNLRKLRLERVAPWLNNDDLINLSQNCTNLIELSLLGCRHLNSESQKIISSGWPGLISVHLEECGEVTSNGVMSLFDCYALEDILLRHNGSGIQKGFIGDAVVKLPMLRKMSLDICDAKHKDFDIPEIRDGLASSSVSIAKENATL
ncbi:BTB/POZ domain-containing protein FBL11 isoform X1 [Tanacetum coccineum]